MSALIIWHEFIFQVSPSRRSILENEMPVTADVLRDPRLYHVTDNAIASAAMRELLEMIVSFVDCQFRALFLGRMRRHDTYTCCMRKYVS